MRTNDFKGTEKRMQEDTDSNGAQLNQEMGSGRIEEKEQNGNEEDRENEDEYDEGLEAMDLLFRLRLAKTIVLIHIPFLTCFIGVIVHLVFFRGDPTLHYFAIIVIVVLDKFACNLHRKREWKKYRDVIGG